MFLTYGVGALTDRDPSPDKDRQGAGQGALGGPNGGVGVMSSLPPPPPYSTWEGASPLRPLFWGWNNNYSRNGYNK